ncbi:hypothetical protein [Asanoa iriomotensis]|uniref:Uncharacterized protein n=1 Tax=Asanoa iriomotensis TaxID=234613 RepID=A0ABQ4BXI1_9ACTN|nr:hypothetical protein [Asanoa iriomotensis]GIF55185.1 hypothetical protein Air01nite_12800 [Asanoa iriomotensis]
MLTLLDEQYAPITKRIGFLRVPLDVAAEGLAAWRHELHGKAAAEPVDGDLPSALRTLEPLTLTVRPRELLVATRSDWTAYFDCGANGSDPISAVGYLSRRLKCSGLAICSAPHTLGTGLEVGGRYGAVQFELFGPEWTDFINYVRTVSVAHDGDSRWRFDAAGQVQEFEDVERYALRRVRDRFTSEMLASYCAALGIRPFDPDFYAGPGVLVTSPAPDAPELTLQDAQERLGIKPGVAAQIPG